MKHEVMTREEYLDKVCHDKCNGACRMGDMTRCIERQRAARAWDAATVATAKRAVNWISSHLAEWSIVNDEDMEALLKELTR